VPREEKPPEQIPWAQRTKVTYQSDLSIALEHTWQGRRNVANKMTADVWHKDFEWSVSKNSKIEIDEYMDLDEKLTKDIQEFWELDQEKNYGKTYRDRIERWLGGGVHSPSQRVGPKEWRPGKRTPKIQAKLANYGYGNTYNEDNSYFWGDVFEFGHFKTDDGDEGAVILWQGGGDPRGNYHLPMVYVGNFEGFMDSQYEHDPWDPDVFLSYNHAFENGFLWSWHKLGVFDDPAEQIVDLKDRHVQQVLRAIEKDPSILLPESVEKILQKAVQWLMQNHRRDLEKALGQKLIWEDLYGD
jgi:hypothetical protein